MFYPISEKNADIFRRYGVIVCGGSTNKIHEDWVIRTLETGFIRDARMINGQIEFVFHGSFESDESIEDYKIYRKTLYEVGRDGIEIEYTPATDELYIKSCDGWILNLHQLQGKELPEYLTAMSEIKAIKEKINHM
ncbi:hypothetical protein ABWK22_01670 [Gottfriedia acidiceleris]|uniref:hypothetical protein n=1 Tax=Gottfriedia acidiceleris TaxID=371036 RepID=UPI003390E170